MLLFCGTGSTFSADDYSSRIAPFLRRYCTGCHGGPKPRSGFSLQFRDEQAARKATAGDEDFWIRVVAAVESEQMPPSGVKSPTNRERKMLIDWINARMLPSR